tara:strand:+ start:1413 stop:1781 length:369 start_codon:yes stop_codon:yes gene_type:complete
VTYVRFVRRKWVVWGVRMLRRLLPPRWKRRLQEVVCQDCGLVTFLWTEFDFIFGWFDVTHGCGGGEFRLFKATEPVRAGEMVAYSCLEEKEDGEKESTCERAEGRESSTSRGGSGGEGGSGR